MHSVRPWVMPNEGFRLQLLEYERLGCDLEQWQPWKAPEGLAMDGFMARFGRHLQQPDDDDESLDL